MKLLRHGLLLIFSVVVYTADSDPYRASSTNLTESEIRELPPETKLKDIELRLRYFTRSAVAIPIISFRIEGSKDDDCLMLFDDETQSLLYAWLSRDQNQDADEAIVLWPKSAAGKRLSEIVFKTLKEGEANQPVDTTPTSAPR